MMKKNTNSRRIGENNNKIEVEKRQRVKEQRAEITGR